MPVAFFIAGTDTDVGKTTVAAGLLRAARLAGMSTAAVKPVAAGCELTADGLRNSDALALLAECSEPLRYAEVNPFAFAPAIAPHLAASEVGVTLEVATLTAAVQAVLDRRADFTLVEGAGGWRVPLNKSATLAQLPIALQLPVIVVVAVRLGCINHALLTVEAIERDGLRVAGWVANLLEPQMPRLEENIAALEARLNAPCLGRIPLLAEPSAANVARYLDLGLLNIQR
ncbi:MAG: dethiobiotin synthase [Pseudomonas sp.]|uniref:dethiobiotin synthase n=1 Tax=Pseudomonas sp. TaxID=306 RepID=UPI0027359CB6|nr:dethiobiotin synthase [Pseudomonas sp.]MDP3847819.1 dethiobiotin synthase [Pseudomonas sp.]